jgi:DNA primase
VAKSLIEVLTEQKVDLIESSNGRWVAHCPFHEGDRSPSFTVYPNDTYYCFGCKVWGNPVKFLVDRGMNTQEAIAYVGVDYTLGAKTQRRVIKIRNTLKIGKFLLEAAWNYHEYLMNNKGPLKYLESRGLTNSTIKRNLLGYSDGSVLSYEFAEEHEMAEEVGLFNKAGYDTLSHRIIIPNIIDGEYCDFMIGRTVINDKSKYLGLRMPKPIMGFHQYRHSPILFMVEGQFDWLLLKQWGYPAVVLSGSHITKHNQQLLRGKFIVYISDNDIVGEAAAQQIIDIFGHNCVVINIAHYGHKDISEWAQYDPLAKTRFEELIQEALCDILSSNPTWEKYVPQLRIPTQLVSI